MPWESCDSEDDNEREIHSLLIMALQKYKEKERSEQELLMVSKQYEENDRRHSRQSKKDEFDIDNLLIMVSLQYKQKEVVSKSCKHQARKEGRKIKAS